MIGKGHRAVKIEAEDHHQQGKRHGRAEQRAEIRASFPILPLGEIVEGADKREDAEKQIRDSEAAEDRKHRETVEHIADQRRTCDKRSDIGHNCLRQL